MKEDNNKHQFKLNKVTLETPFELNDDQKKLLRKLALFHDKEYDKKKSTFGIMGYAGTGKTVVITLFYDYIMAKSKWSNVFFSSPTHRANVVMKQKNPKIDVATLHSLFGLQPFLQLERFDTKKLKFVKKKNKDTLSWGSTLIVDEASMVNDELYKFITDEAKKLEVKVIFVGDPEQLQPVGSTKKSKSFTDVPFKFELTKVERTGDNPLLKEATTVRGSIDEEPFTMETDVNEDNEGVVFLRDSKEFMIKATDLFTSDEFKENPLLVRILAATNFVVANYNTAIRGGIWEKEEKNEYNVGEILMGYTNWGGMQSKILNGVDYEVTEVYEDTIYINEKTYPGYWLGLKKLVGDEYYTVQAFILSRTLMNKGAVIEQLATYIEGLRQAALKEPDYFKKKECWQRYFKVVNAFISPFDISLNGRGIINKGLDYGYAHTVHKSQGGTYSQVFVDNKDIEFAFNKDWAVRKQLKYVAITRAEKMATIIT